MEAGAPEEAPQPMRDEGVEGDVGEVPDADGDARPAAAAAAAAGAVGVEPRQREGRDGDVEGIDAGRVGGGAGRDVLYDVVVPGNE